ncbi:hypothetical protein CUT44_25805 [Streptomyces carminius]|uniref:Uncharacterized protein n=1 Tax=Streptomyces carminius TaxID=2665496 RepID=A0A2M8LSY7_9ACTN|nr:hypothetical protein [Streptomyces carminius]PJE95068.1 hypothetical protein CUT44_25805 [Streptomyces carminius]
MPQLRALPAPSAARWRALLAAVLAALALLAAAAATGGDTAAPSPRPTVLSGHGTGPAAG